MTDAWNDPADLAGRWPLPDRTDLRDRLLAAYAGRGYHDTRHLAEVLDRLDELTAGEPAVELVLAAWFHDAVYDGSAEDEERSAQLAESELTGERVDVVEVARLVRLTAAHDPAADDEAGALLSDADLAILAARPERYEEYAAGVRRDYASVPDDQFRVGRAEVLRELIGREALFRTEHARAYWEARARVNLVVELDNLEGLEGPEELSD